MNIHAAIQDFGQTGRLETEADTGGRRGLHKGRFAGSGDIRSRRRLIDLEPIEPIQARTEAQEVTADPAVNTHRGRVINLRV